MDPFSFAVLAAALLLNALALLLFLKSRKEYKNSQLEAAAAAEVQKAKALHAKALESLKGNSSQANVSTPLALKSELSALQEELLALRARLNSHEVTHLSANASTDGTATAMLSASEMPGLKEELEKLRKENFSQLTEAAVQLSEIEERIASLEQKLSQSAPAEEGKSAKKIQA